MVVMVMLAVQACATATGSAVRATCAPVTSRRAAVGRLAPALLLPWLPNAASAADKSKAFTNCVSNCVYEKTKITKGIAQVEVMSREEAFAVCKPECRKKT